MVIFLGDGANGIATYPHYNPVSWYHLSDSPNFPVDPRPQALHAMLPSTVPMQWLLKPGVAAPQGPSLQQRLMGLAFDAGNGKGPGDVSSG